MRLDDYDNDIQVEDRGTGGGMGMGGRGGQVGCGTLVIALIAALAFGVDPSAMLSDGQATQQPSAPQQGMPAGSTTADICGASEIRSEACNTLSSLDRTWQPIFAAANIPFRRPKLAFYDQATQSGCGSAQSAMGPFYCPADQGIYIDTDFFTEMEQRLGAQGDFARRYVIAHEYGHHIQTITGLSDQIRSAQAQNPRAANNLQVRMELQADCYAGVWAAKNADRIEPGDLEEGLQAAYSIGDDTLMRQAGRRPVEEAFTHGTSEQRMQWLRRGLQTGSDEACDETFADLGRR